MNDWLKRGLFLAFAVGGGWKAYTYYQGSNTVHQVVFRVEGPTSCQVQIRHEAGSTNGNESTTLEWQSEPIETRGHAALSLTVDIPLSCNWQPSQVHCFIDRDGAPWKNADTTRITNERDGSPASQRCAVTARATE